MAGEAKRAPQVRLRCHSVNLYVQVRFSWELQVLEPHYSHDESIIGPDGIAWREVTGWLEPDDVRNLVDLGARIAIHDCDGWRWGVKFDERVAHRLVTAERSHGLARGKYPEEVILAASLWEIEGSGDRLVVLAEETPKRRKIIEEIIEDSLRPELQSTGLVVNPVRYKRASTKRHGRSR
jgi:hypothetical protein